MQLKPSARKAAGDTANMRPTVYGNARRSSSEWWFKHTNAQHRNERNNTRPANDAAPSHTLYLATVAGQ